jgi:aminopeptidase N
MKLHLSASRSLSRQFILFFAALAAVLAAAPANRADEPYARSRDYDLQHSRIALRFDVSQKKVFGEVTHSISILRDGTSKLAFDSVDLTIKSVSINKSAAPFETTSAKLYVSLPAPAKSGDRFSVTITYEGKPRKGLYFILPDKDYPDKPAQIWSQGESEDTRYYIPTYDYPNDRLTTDTILTVPAAWVTISNGKLISVTDTGVGLKTWTWKESLPSSTYLITVVAGEFDEIKESWRGKPVTYYAPKGRGNRLPINYGRTPAMLDLFTKKLGVEYPWEKYAQVMVDDFVAGGMENSSATTNTSSSLIDPRLAPEYFTGQDGLISHELGHQWFGDLVTCKDWGDVWLNEGFATFMEGMWMESHFGKDQGDFERWEASRNWIESADLWNKPIVRHDFNDGGIFDGNSYTKGGWVLYMLRHQLGDDAFYGGLKHYLEVNRGKNAVTADLVSAIEEATHTDVDQFFNQWVYGAGAPKLDISYAYDAAKHQIALAVKQTQKLEGHVGLFAVPTTVEVTTSAGSKSFPITVSKSEEVFSFAADSAPLLVLFDKGGHVLKSAEFHKDKKEWIYQLKNATELADRADAVIALAAMKTDDEAITAVAEALRGDKSWGVRTAAADALADAANPVAIKYLTAVLDSKDDPWVRNRAAAALGSYKSDPAVSAKLESVAKSDASFRTRAAALQSLGKLKSPGALPVLEAAIASDSPDDILRNAALRALGSLGDDKAVPLLRQWIAVGKPTESRTAAINSLAKLDKENKEITKEIASHLAEPRFSVRISSVFALGARGDASAIPALESLLNGGDLSIEFAPMIRGQIERLKKPDGGKDAHPGAEDRKPDSNDSSAVTEKLEHLEKLIQEMSARLKSIETRLPPPKQ